MATKEEFARVEVATKEEFAKVEKDIAGLESKMATKDDVVGVKDDIARLEKQIAVLSFAVLTGVPAILAFMVKLAFFP